MDAMLHTAINIPCQCLGNTFGFVMTVPNVFHHTVISTASHVPTLTLSSYMSRMLPSTGQLCMCPCATDRTTKETLCQEAKDPPRPATRLEPIPIVIGNERKPWPLKTTHEDSSENDSAVQRMIFINSPLPPPAHV